VVGQVGELPVRQLAAAGCRQAREVDAGSPIARQAAVLDRGVEHRRESSQSATSVDTAASVGNASDRMGSAMTLARPSPVMFQAYGRCTGELRAEDGTTGDAAGPAGRCPQVLHASPLRRLGGTGPGTDAGAPEPRAAVVAAVT
jgi:hypothetical protein